MRNSHAFCGGVAAGLLCGALVLGFAGCKDTESDKTPALSAVAVVNATCPIMNSDIDSNNVPAELTRTFKGQTVGFCCAGCPAAWDKLTDENKQAKLDAAMAAE